MFQIRSTEPLLTAYRSVSDIYLDYNEIETIEALESDNWLERFSVLSLKGNRLQKVCNIILRLYRTPALTIQILYVLCILNIQGDCIYAGECSLKESSSSCFIFE